MSNGGTNGLKTAVALAGGVGDLGLGAAEQLDAFEADAPLPVSAVARGKSGDKGGRPVGARNKSTEEARQYFLSRYRSPLIGLGEIYSRTPEDLARELQMTRIVHQLIDGQEVLQTLKTAEGEVRGYVVWDRERAFDKQVAALQAALPYVERKQPIAIDTNGKVAGLIVIGDMAGMSDAGDGVLTLDLDAQPIEQKQQLSSADAIRPDAMQSDDTAKPQKPMGEFKDDL